MIQAVNLVKRYGEKEALGGVSFSIGPGEIVGLLGLNGAGKSTTMNILTGYLSASSGSVTIDGHDIVKDPIACKRVIGYMPEQFSFYPDMRVSEYLDFVCDLKGFSSDPKNRKRHLSGICARVGISKMTGRMIRNLSKGYRQRVGFAQALVGDPKVLILDEPTVGLDPSQIIEIRQLIKDSGKDSTVIVSSHILSEIQAICSRVIVIHEGGSLRTARRTRSCRTSGPTIALPSAYRARGKKSRPRFPAFRRSGASSRCRSASSARRTASWRGRSAAISVRTCFTRWQRRTCRFCIPTAANSRWRTCSCI